MLLEENRLALSRLLDLWDDLVDRKVGIVNTVTELPIDTDDPDFFHFLATACDTSRFSPLRNFGNTGGVSTDRYVAIAKAVGEAIERYCAAIFDYDELVYAAYDELGEPATDPVAFALYRPEQLARPGMPWQAFTRSTRVAWVRGISQSSGTPVLVPAAMVYVPYHYTKARGDASIAQPISTGLALGASWPEAVFGALCEVIERDAFTITWQARLARPVVAADSLPTSCADLVGRFARVGLEVMVMDITGDIRLPTLLTVAVGRAPTSPAVAVAAATDRSAETALVKSLEELAHTRKFAKQVMDYMPETPVEPELMHPAVRDQKDHLRFYCPQHAKRFAEFLWSSPERRSFAAVADHAARTSQQALDGAVRELADAGLDVIVCDLTTPDVAELGLRCVRVVVPGMHPLQMGYANRALGGRRLHELPQRLGYPGLEPGQPDNPFPHPFP